MRTEEACRKKRRYPTKDEATRVGVYQELTSLYKLRVYFCNHCNNWHLTKTDGAFQKAGILGL